MLPSRRQTFDDADGFAGASDPTFVVLIALLVVDPILVVVVTVPSSVVGDSSSHTDVRLLGVGTMRDTGRLGTFVYPVAVQAIAAYFFSARYRCFEDFVELHKTVPHYESLDVDILRSPCKMACLAEAWIDGSMDRWTDG